MNRILTLLHFSFLLLLFNSYTIFAQSPIPRDSIAPNKKGAEFSIDLSGIALGLSLASRRQNHSRFGVTLTFGVELANFVIGSKFYSTYSIKAKEWNARTMHVLALQIFGRKQKWGHFENEFGFRIAVGLHEDNVWTEDWETRTFNLFWGGYMQPIWGKGFFKIGSRIALGVYNQGVGLELTPMFRFTF